MNISEKQASVDALKEQFDEYKNFYITDTSGLDVEKINQIRRKCFEQKIKLQVAKNNIIRRALKSLKNNTESLEEVLVGSSSIMYSKTANAPAKLIKKFQGILEKPTLKGAYIDGDLFGSHELNELVNLKSKEELLGELVNLLQSPLQNVVSAVQSGQNTLFDLLKSLEKRSE